METKFNKCVESKCLDWDALPVISQKVEANYLDKGFIA
jgi:hypothetical protein